MKKGKKLEIRVQRVISASHKLLKQEPLYYRTKTKVSRKTVTFYMYLNLICFFFVQQLFARLYLARDIKYLVFFFRYQVSETSMIHWKILKVCLSQLTQNKNRKTGLHHLKVFFCFCFFFLFFFLFFF